MADESRLRRQLSLEERDQETRNPLIATAGDTEINIPASEMKQVDDNFRPRSKSIVSVNTKGTGWYRFLGIGLTLLAGFLMSTANVCSKWLKDRGYEPFFITFIKYQGMTTISLLHVFFLVCYKKQTIFNTIWPPTGENMSNVLFLFVRATFGTIATCLLFTAFTYLTAADAVTICYCTPIATIFLARIFLKEPIGLISVGVAFLAVFGVVFITRPPFLTQGEFSETILIGVTFAFFAMIGMSCVFVTVRYLRKVHYGLVMVGYGYIGSLECIIVAIVYGVMKDKNFFDIFVLPGAWSHLLVMSFVAVFSMIGQTLLVLALQYENAGPVSLLRTCDIIFNFVLQYFINNQAPDVWSLIGAAIVILASLIFGFRKFIQLLPEDDPRKKTYKCFLL
ncbi:solute carrier family 35 member G1 [Folsomia candida]|uniref:EamA domain-containing protein n=1 Tax=Folsomia candida TaxID=158441 RepID=A0A226F7F8_FOLCA|nr:solute carrier family 35 member G1 [Folsomia candida]XP_035707533.1 solute carrier family 35 member G1 [Folsomia candida]OXA65141.1 hypothetical protein Fcan01_01715 [Folsomia candida]